MMASEAVVVDEASDTLIINDRFRRSPTGPQAQRERNLGRLGAYQHVFGRTRANMNELVFPLISPAENARAL
ncbi:hypothetical protein, partial [Streptomyces hirsutus]|uniref:hypothetical protein n=1 Tax=Streptomyces hirsutus TaxID=35620 RepID=UPI0033A62AA4